MPSHGANVRLARRQIIDVDNETLLKILRQNIASLELDLSGLAVAANAGQGYEAFVATAAALAGASRVLAVFRDSRTSGSDGSRAMLTLNEVAGLADRVQVLDHISSREWHDVDIVANSTRAEPISRSVIELLPAHAVIALMAEPWELEPGSVDIDACRDTGIRLAAPNYDHPAVMMHREFARLCCVLMEEAGLDFRDRSFAILSDTPLAPFIERALTGRGAEASVFPHPLLLGHSRWDAVIVAMSPSARQSVNVNALGHIREKAGNALLVQFSGDVDRSAASYFGLQVWPPKRPGRGQLGLPFDAAGPDPSIRRLVAGLKAAEIIYRGTQRGRDDIGRIVEEELWRK